MQFIFIIILIVNCIYEACSVKIYSTNTVDVSNLWSNFKMIYSKAYLDNITDLERYTIHKLTKPLWNQV